MIKILHMKYYFMNQIGLKLKINNIEWDVYTRYIKGVHCIVLLGSNHLKSIMESIF